MARHYTLPPTEYDYDEIFNQQEENEAQLQLLNDPHIVKYRTKTIKSGNFLEVEVYPIWDTRSATARARRTKESREAQKRLNYKNATKNVIRLINANFTDSDFWGTFTYESRKLPKSLPDAQKEMSKFIRRLKYYAEKHDFPPLKYIYVTEFENDEEKGKHRVHHHVVTNFPDRDVMEDLWRNGGRNNTRRLVADDSGYISCNTKADTVYKILCSACLCLLSSVFPLVFAIGGASTKYEKDSATLYRPTIEYGLKVGQPASAKNILIDKTKTPSQEGVFYCLFWR